MKGFILLLSFFFLAFESSAQSVDYAREVVNTLASDEFKGRGYVEDGDKLAANFIREEFKRFGLSSYTDNFFQEYSVSVNTFPQSMIVKVNGDLLEPGKDYLIHPTSRPTKGAFQVVYISPKDLLSDQLFNDRLKESLGNFVVIEDYDLSNYTEKQQGRLKAASELLRYDPRSPAIGAIDIEDKKLTWSVSPYQSSKSGIIIKRDSFEDKISNIEVEFIAEYKPDYLTQNVIAYVEGKRSDSTIVFMAHYDHLGKLGSNTVFNGANDNASGMAMLLSLASYYSKNKPDFNIAFIAFGAEELGLLGSKYFIENPLFDLSKTKFFMNFDIAGTGDEGIQVVNGSVYQNEFDLLSQINTQEQLLPAVKIRGAACNSDHCMFDQLEIPGFYIYTLGGIQAYHDIYDRSETLPLTEFEDYFSLLIEFIQQL